MRLRPLLIAAALGAALTSALGACNSTDSGSTARNSFGETFNTDNYRFSPNTDGTQTRRDVNRQYTQPPLPSILFRGN